MAPFDSVPSNGPLKPFLNVNEASPAIGQTPCIQRGMLMMSLW